MKQPRDSKGRFVSVKNVEAEEKVYARGFKGFEPGMVCKGKHYAENTVFEEPEANLCSRGMHFCQDPIEVLNYYPLLNEHAEANEFAEVESLAEPIYDDSSKAVTTRFRIGKKLSDDSSKAVTTKLRIGRKLSIKQYGLVIADALRKYGMIDNSGTFASSSSQLCGCQTGTYMTQAQSGFGTLQVQTGIGCCQAQSGSQSTQMQNGERCEQVQANFFSTQTQTGNNCIQAQTGNNCRQAQFGRCCAQVQAGPLSAQTQYGIGSRQASVGEKSSAAAYGENSLVAALGPYSKAKGALGCVLIFVAYALDSFYGLLPYKAVSVVVDGEKIKADTWYKLVGEELVEAGTIEED